MIHKTYKAYLFDFDYTLEKLWKNRSPFLQASTTKKP